MKQLTCDGHRVQQTVALGCLAELEAHGGGGDGWRRGVQRSAEGMD